MRAKDSEERETSRADAGDECMDFEVDELEEEQDELEEEEDDEDEEHGFENDRAGTCLKELLCWRFGLAIGCSSSLPLLPPSAPTDASSSLRLCILASSSCTCRDAFSEDCSM